MAGHVLVVDDDDATREIYTNVMELMGLSFATATNGIEALAEVKK